MKNTTTTLMQMKGTDKKISMITAYDYTTAKILDECGVNTILVGDSLGNTILGYEDTISVRDAVRHGEDRQIRAKLEEAVLMKPKQHCFDAWQDITEHRKMVQIGG